MKKIIITESQYKRIFKEGSKQGLLYVSSGGSKYILSRDGLAGKRLKQIIPDLQKYLNDNGYSGTLGLDGVMRELNDAANTTDPDREAGSLHGAGLAIDITFNLDGKKWGGIVDNKNLASDKKLNKLIGDWVESQGDLVWGGEWDGSNPSEGIVKGRGITEYHHFAIKESDISQYWQPYSDTLSKLGFDANELNSADKLLPLYQKLLNTNEV